MSIEPTRFSVQKLVNNLIKEADLYLTLFVTGLLAIAHFFHILIDDKEVLAAILCVLILVTFNSLRHRSKIEGLYKSAEDIKTLITQISTEPGVRWYVLRDESDSDMYNDLNVSRKIVFIGASQLSLANYLHHALTLISSGSSRSLPWQEIEVFFAAPDFGELYEKIDGDFLSKVRKARHAIAACLTNPRYEKSIPSFRSIRLFQVQLPMAYSGSMFSSGNQGDIFDVIYAVHSKFRGEFNRALTTRFAAVAATSSGTMFDAQSARIAHYTDVYHDLRRESGDIGAFQMSLWDKSADSWSQFGTQSQVLIKSMSALVDLCGISPDEHILELGAGPGDASRILVQRVASGKVTLLDASPQMIAHARRRFEDDSRVNFALCTVRHDLPESHIDLKGEKFTLVVIHQSFGNLVSSFGNDMTSLANWCFHRVAPGGRLVIAAHNGVVETEPPSGWKDWSDGFRHALSNEIKRIPAWKGHIRPQKPSTKYNTIQIEQAFSSQQFVQEKKDTTIIPMTMDDRVLMWRAPAVMNEVVDVAGGGTDQIAMVCDNLRDQFAGQSTMPQTVTYWVLRRK